MKFSVKDFFSKCQHIRRKLRICLHLLKQSLMENVFCAVQCVGEKLFTSEKSCLFYSILTLTKLKYFMSYTIKSHCQQGDVLRVEQDIVSKEFLERFWLHLYKTLFKRWIFDDSDEIEVRFLFYRSFSIFSNACGGLCAQAFYSWVKKWLKIKSHLFNTRNNIETMLATTPKIYC